MKILFLVTYYYPYWTGLTQYAKRLAERFAREKREVTVLTIKHIPSLPEKDKIHGVRIIRKPFLARLSRGFISLALLLSLWRYIPQHEVIFVYLPFPEVFIAALIAKFFHKKIILVHNGDLVLPKGFLNRVIEKFYYISSSSAIRMSDTVIIQTADYAKHSKLLSRFQHKWKEILPLYDEMVGNQSIIKKLVAKLDLNKKYVVGFAGRFVEEKGFDILLESMPIVFKELPDTKFVFAGETNIGYENFFSKNKTLIEKNKKNLIFLGRLTEKEIANFYKVCSVFVISSRTDCFPSTQVEALLCRVPIVVTNIPGARWPVKKTHMGIIVKASDPKALAKGIIEVLKNREKYCKPAFLIARLFNYDKTFKKYQDLLV